MIGEAIGKSVNTVRKYVMELEERGLIRTERTTVTTWDGRKQNAAELAAERQKAEKRLAALERKERAAGC